MATTPDFRPMIRKADEKRARRISHDELDATLKGNTGQQILRHTIRRDGRAETIVSFYYMPDATRYRVTEFFAI